ncbi:response regulator [Cohnella thermotolerans]|uniref:response regulator n=1 Tax=Cohnella thermotolerans TaxID=329858 RepID=UPI00040464C9|nr:response regulator [Cohnella thermotolerans]
MYKALLVDDEPFAIDALKLFVDWEAHGFEICGACEDGEEALEAIGRLGPDVVVTDIRMPAVDGLQLIELAQSRYGRRVHFVVLSGYGEFEYARSALRQGVAHYLLKPIVPEEAAYVLADIRSKLDAARAADSLRALRDRERLAAALSRLLEADGEDAEDAVWDDDLEALSRQCEEWRVLLLEAEQPDDAGRAVREAARRHGHAYVPADAGFGPAAAVCGTSCFAGAEAFVNAIRETLDRPEAHSAYRLAVGLPQRDLRTIRHSYASALAVLQAFYFDRARDAVRYAEKEPAPSAAAGLGLADGRPFLEALEWGDGARLRAEAAQLRETLRDGRQSPSSVAAFLDHLLYRSALVLQQAGIDPAERLREWESFTSGQGALPSLDGSFAALERFAEAAAEAMAEARALRGAHPLQAADRYIREHFREPISVKGLAETFFLNAAYLGQAYQARYGKSVLERVHDLRIAEALRLIREDPGRKMADIAESVGYAHYNHFLKQFEKRCGAKPTSLAADSQNEGDEPEIRSL